MSTEAVVTLAALTAETLQPVATVGTTSIVTSATRCESISPKLQVTTLVPEQTP